MLFLTDKKRHLICYPYSIKNLHKMAKFLKIRKWWFHQDHYDIPIKQIDRIESLCIIISTKNLIKIARYEMKFELIESLGLKVEHLIHDEKEKLEQELKVITDKIHIDEDTYLDKFDREVDKIKEVLDKYKVEIENKL